MEQPLSDGPNWPLWEAAGISIGILAASTGLLWAHHRRDGRAEQKKIKNRVTRSMIEDIRGRLELSERLPRIDFRTTALELRSILEDYIEDHNSQKRYLQPYITRIDSILSSSSDYDRNREQLIEVIDDIQEDING